MPGYMKFNLAGTLDEEPRGVGRDRRITSTMFGMIAGLEGSLMLT